MRKTKPTLLLMTMLAALFLSCFCFMPDQAEAAQKMELSRKKTTLYVGDSEKLFVVNATSEQRNRIKWKTTDAEIVTVTKKGEITAEAAGEATVTAKLAGKKYKCVVTVKDPGAEYYEVPEEGNQIYQDDVAPEMTSAAFWFGRVKKPYDVLMDQEAIAELNAKDYAADGTNMVDLKNRSTAYDSETAKTNLTKELMEDVRVGRIGSHETIWKDGQELNAEAIDAWFAEMKANIENAETRTDDTRKYGICVKRADLWMAPTNALVGWSEKDADSEFINSSVLVNEPVLMGLTTADGQYVHVLTSNVSGWVEADHFAVVDDKDAWLAQWDFTGRDDVLIVTDAHIALEESNLAPRTSKLDLHLGTQLPLVPKEKLQGVAERYPWYSYTVYLPVRGEDGKLEREMALISSHNKVSIGFPEMNEKNILTIAFNCLGNRYGWGGMLGSMDCSLYTRSIYRCFGLELPRNTNWQTAMPVSKTEITEFTEDQKKEVLDSLAPGSLLMFPGHITMYLGEVDGKYYVISDLGSLSESTGDVNVKSIYTVSINSLDVRRRNGNTWLAEMKWAVTPFLAAD